MEDAAECSLLHSPLPPADAWPAKSGFWEVRNTRPFAGFPFFDLPGVRQKALSLLDACTGSEFSAPNVDRLPHLCESVRVRAGGNGGLLDGTSGRLLRLAVDGAPLQIGGGGAGDCL
ncbi:MAG: hypothetical protein ACOVT5_00090 [Armatimonadaceae bacterium]